MEDRWLCFLLALSIVLLVAGVILSFTLSPA